MTRKRILPEIKLPDVGETTAVIIGSTILFIHLDYDDSPQNPCEDMDGVGKIDAIESREFRGIDSNAAVAALYIDDDVVPLRYISHGGQCQWSIYEDHENVYGECRAEKVIRRLRGEDPDQWGIVGFEPIWESTIDGTWTPDQCVRESYMGQDGLSRREWMVKQAESACEQYTDYCNGSVYGYDIQLHTLRKDDDGDPIEDLTYYQFHKPLSEGSCWGFYGFSYFKDEVLGQVKSILKAQKFSRRAISAAIREAA